MDIIRCTEKDIQMLYDDSAWTWIGLSATTDSLEDVIKWFKEQGCPLKEETFYVFTGKQLNEFCGGLTRDNAYKDDLTCVSIMLDNITDLPKLYMKKFEIGARWLDDIVENAKAREK